MARGRIAATGTAVLLVFGTAGCRSDVSLGTAQPTAPENEQPAVKMVEKFPMHLLKEPKSQMLD